MKRLAMFGRSIGTKLIHATAAILMGQLLTRRLCHRRKALS